MWTIAFQNNNQLVVWVCQSKSVYETELERLRRLGLPIKHHGPSMYIREDDGTPFWSKLASRMVVGVQG